MTGTPDMSALLAQAQQMQQKLATAQEELGRTEVEGSAGGGAVRATVTGTGDLTGLTISPEACDPTDTETLADLVVAAVRDATANAGRVAQERLGPLAQGFGSMPGLGGP